MTKQCNRVRLPAISPFPFGCTFQTGKLDQGVVDTLEMVDTEHLPFWAVTINNHKKELQELLLNEDSLKSWAARGHGYIESRFIKFDDIDEDDELYSMKQQKNCQDDNG